MGFCSVVVGSDGRVRAFDLTLRRPPRPPEVHRLLERAMRTPGPGIAPQQPRTIAVEDPETAGHLQGVFAGTDADVREGSTPQADAALDALEARGPRSDWAPAWWYRQSKEDITRYFEAANEFLRVEPWTALPPDNCVAVRVEKGPWCYVSVMGQNAPPDQHPGISLFDSWRSYESLVASPAPEAAPGLITKIGGLEGVTFQPIWSLHPRDAQFLIRFGIVRPGPKDVFLPHRYEADGLRAPTHTLADVTSILQGIAKRFPGRRISRSRRPHVGRYEVRALRQTVTLHYPCQGPIEDDGDE